MDNMVSIERIKIRDIFIAIGELFSTSKDMNNIELVNKKLEKVYEVEKEIGATKAIMAAEKFLEKVSSRTSRKKSIEKVDSVQVDVKSTNIELNNQSEKYISKDENEIGE